MNKIKITADAILNIIQGLFKDEEINTLITDPAAPFEWQNKTLADALNVEYFTLKYRPISTEDIIAEKLKNGKDFNKLAGTDRGFCSVSVRGIERLFSKDVDTAVVTAEMEYWIQTDKVKLLEFLIEDCNIATSGLRIPVVFGKERRKAVIIFSLVNIADIRTETICGEIAVCSVTVNILLYPDVVSYSDYSVKFRWTNERGEVVSMEEAMPLTSLSFVNTMTQRAVPYAANHSKVGSINLSCANSFVLVFDGWNNAFVNKIVSDALDTQQTENNQIYQMEIKRGETTYRHEVIIKDHQVSVNADTGNETHTLSLVTRGKR